MLRTNGACPLFPPKIVQGHLGAATGLAADQPAAEPRPDKPQRKIKLGLVGYHRGCACAAMSALLCFIAGMAFAQSQSADTAPELNRAVTLDVGGGAKMELVLVRPGSFVMGDERGGAGERPAHKVTVTKPFFIGKYLVTQRQWEAVMGNNPSWFQGAAKPVENITWDDCQVFLAKLGEKCGGGTEAFSLPTEAQWEYACRAGSTAQYSFGDDGAGLGEYAWFSGNSRNETHPVGEKKPNAWGLYDMHGNVWQWCADGYDAEYYKASPASNPAGPAGKDYAVIRGGGWESERPLLSLGVPLRTCRGQRPCELHWFSGHLPWGRAGKARLRSALAGDCGRAPCQRRHRGSCSRGR